MSTARSVPETWELAGDDARETLLSTGPEGSRSDAFVRITRPTGSATPRSFAFRDVAPARPGDHRPRRPGGVVGDTELRDHRSHINERGARPGRRGAHHRGRPGVHHRGSGQHLVLVFIGVTTLVTGTTLMGQMERVLNRLYGVEQDRPTVQKYGRAFVLAVTTGALSPAAFAMLALGHGIGELHDDTVTNVWKVVRWPLAVALMVAAIALLFRWSPRRHQPAWSWLAFGSTVSVMLWWIATLGLGLFFRASTSFGDTYGPLAGIIALLLWAMLRIAILFGAASPRSSRRCGRRAPNLRRSPRSSPGRIWCRPGPGRGRCRSTTGS